MKINKINFNYNNIQPTNCPRKPEKLKFEQKTDCVCFSSTLPLEKVEIVDISTQNPKEIFKTLMKFNRPDGPMVNYLVKHYSELHKNKTAEYFKTALSQAYFEQAKTIVKIAKKDDKTKIFTALNPESKEIIGIIVLLPVGKTKGKNNNNIYEICNFGVMPDNQTRGLGSKILAETVDFVKKEEEKAVIFAKVTNPASKRVFEKNDFASRTDFSSFFRKELGDDYSKNKFLFKEININKEDLSSFSFSNPVGASWLRGWPERNKFDK